MIQPEIERVEDTPDGRRPQLAVAAGGPAQTHRRQLSRTVSVAPVGHIAEPAAAGSIVGRLALACQIRRQHSRQTRQPTVPEVQYHQGQFQGMEVC